ncbi:MAG: GtrA family protein [Caulobacteraceae bacterium]
MTFLLSSKVRFLMVSGVCALLHNVIMIGGDRLGLHYLASSLVSYVVVMLVGFCLHVGFTYQETASARSFFRYALAMAANYPLSVALMFVQCDLIGLPVAIAAPVATVLLLAWNFGATRWAVVRGKRLPDTGPSEGI